MDDTGHDGWLGAMMQDAREGFDYYTDFDPRLKGPFTNSEGGFFAIGPTAVDALHKVRDAIVSERKAPEGEAWAR